MSTDYEALIRSLLDGNVPVAEFEKKYLRAFKNEPAGMDSRTFQVLDKLFSDVDAYSPDCEPGEETPFEISEVELRKRAANALRDLAALRA